MGIQLRSSKQPPQPHHEDLYQPDLPEPCGLLSRRWLPQQKSSCPTSPDQEHCRARHRHPPAPLCWPPSKLPASLTLSLARVPLLSSPPPTMPLPRSQRRPSTAFWLTRTPSPL